MLWTTTHRARTVKVRARLPLARVKQYSTMCVILVLVGATGCTSGEQPGDLPPNHANNHLPVIKSASILPDPVVLSNPLTVRVDAQDLDGQNIVFRYRWLVNGQAVSGGSQASLTPDILKRGDQVAVEVTPFDGIAEGTVFRTAAMPVVNTAPIIAHASVEVDQAVRGRQLLANAEVIDPDRDSVTVTYRWSRNDTIVKEGESNTFDLTGITAKDMIQVEIVASDGAVGGVSTKSAHFKLANSPPTITSHPPSIPGGGQFAYLVQAADEDGDPVTYALDMAPPGMHIDAKTGQILWTASPNLQGTHLVRVVAQDDRGGVAAQEFGLSIAPSVQPISSAQPGEKS